MLATYSLFSHSIRSNMCRRGKRIKYFSPAKESRGLHEPDLFQVIDLNTHALIMEQGQDGGGYLVVAVEECQRIRQLLERHHLLDGRRSFAKSDGEKRMGIPVAASSLGEVRTRLRDAGLMGDACLADATWRTSSAENTAKGRSSSPGQRLLHLCRRVREFFSPPSPLSSSLLLALSDAADAAAAAAAAA